MFGIILAFIAGVVVSLVIERIYIAIAATNFMKIIEEISQIKA